MRIILFLALILAAGCGNSDHNEAVNFNINAMDKWYLKKMGQIERDEIACLDRGDSHSYCRKWKNFEIQSLKTTYKIEVEKLQDMLK